MKLEWQAAELDHVSWHLIDGHEKMARRFSHEMHDELGQSLSGLRRMLSLVPDTGFSSIRKESIGIVDEVLQDVRKLSQALRPVLNDFGLDSGLRWLCERFTQRTQIPVDYTSNTKVRLVEPLKLIFSASRRKRLLISQDPLRPLRLPLNWPSKGTRCISQFRITVMA